MFRTIQHNPRIVTIFHNAASPVSGQLLKTLQKAASTAKFELEVHHEYPTSDQLNLIKFYHGADLSTVFPKTPEQTTWGSPIAEAAKEGFFKAPLVVDWEHNTTAATQAQLEQLLRKY